MTRANEIVGHHTARHTVHLLVVGSTAASGSASVAHPTVACLPLQPPSFDVTHFTHSPTYTFTHLGTDFSPLPATMLHSLAAAAALSLVAAVLLLSCPLSHAGIQAFFFTDSSCLTALKDELPISSQTYLDWGHIPTSQVNFAAGINQTCITPPYIDSPNVYFPVSVTLNCNVNGTGANSTAGLYVAEWLTANQCSGFFSSPSASNQPDYLYTAQYIFGGNGSCMAGATYTNKSSGNTLQLYSQIYCIDNDSGVSSTASVTIAALLATVLVALVVSV